MTQLEGLIHYWESVLKEYCFLVEPSTLSHVESTIKYLKELQSLKEGEK